MMLSNTSKLDELNSKLMEKAVELYKQVLKYFFENHKESNKFHSRSIICMIMDHIPTCAN